MFRKKSAPKTIDSLIGASTRFEGDVSFRGGLRIDGHVRGNVSCTGDAHGLLVIGEHARVDGDIVARHLVVNGQVEGRVFVDGLVDLQARARVAGEVRYRQLEIHRGAVVVATLAPIDEEARPGLKLASSKDAKGRSLAVGG